MTRTVGSGIGEAISSGDPLIRRIREGIPLDNHHALPGLFHQGEGHLVPLIVSGKELGLIRNPAIGLDFQILDRGRPCLRRRRFLLFPKQR